MGLFAVADVQVLRRLIETAQQVVEGNASVGAGLLWGLVLALLALLQAAVLYGRDMLARHHQEVLAAFVEERCLQQAQSMPLEWFEHDEHYDLLHRVRGRTVGRLGHTMTFLWGSLSLFVALMSLLLYLGQFHWDCRCYWLSARPRVCSCASVSFVSGISWSVRRPRKNAASRYILA